VGNSERASHDAPDGNDIVFFAGARFKAPVRPGDTVHSTVTVRERMSEKRRVSQSSACTVDGKVVIDCDALVMLTSRRVRPH
jgi:3-hydroxybutyryl-CoA dehydratase